MLNCELCGNPYRLYSPWDEPPENHYYHCDRCNRAWYPNLPKEFSYDEMVEAGARALADWDGADWDRPEPEFDTHEAITKRAYRAGATAVLSAVLGSRDADAPGDRSTT